MLIYPRGHYVSLNEESLPEDKEGRECLIPFRENSYVLLQYQKKTIDSCFCQSTAVHIGIT